MPNSFRSNDGLKRMRDWLNEIQDLPNTRMTEALDRALHEAAYKAATETHVDTGMLKGSMQSTSEKTADGWEGEISWNTKYTVYEFARDGHDPRNALKSDEEEIDRIIRRGPDFI